LKKSISKLILLFFIFSAVGLILFFASVGFKALLLENKVKIAEQLSAYLNHETTIDSIIYIPPNVLILNNISVSYSEDNEKKGSPLFVKSIRLKFSLSQLLEKKNIVVNTAVFVNPRIDYNKHQIFFKENIEGIIKAIKFLARGRPLKLVFEQAECIFGRKGSSGKMLLGDAIFTIDLESNIESTGRISYSKFKETDLKRKVEKNLLDPGFFYVFKGALVPGGLSIKSVEFNSAYIQAALKGEIIKSVLKLKGFSTLKNFYGRSLMGVSNKVKRVLEKIKNFLRYGRLPQKTGILAGGINLLDINCLIKFDSKHILVQSVEFYLNNIPVRFQGEAAFGDKILTKIKLLTFPDQNEEKRALNPQRLDIVLKSSTAKGKTSGESDIVFLDTAHQGTSLLQVKTSFSNLSAAVFPDTRLKILIEKIAVQYRRNLKVFNFMLSDLASIFNFMDKGVKFVKFGSRLYDGTLNGYIAADIEQLPPKIICNLKVAKVSAWQLDSLLLSLFGVYRRLPTKLQGRIDGQFTCDLDYVNHPVPRLKGQATIEDGYLDNVKFFVWLGEFFGLPDLSRVNFSELSVQFELTPEASLLKNIKLKAEKVMLEGNFLLNSNEFVTSNISIVLAREYLKTSGKFNMLFALMDKKTQYLNFDFQLSGIYKTLNFKWQKSAFKQRLRKILPGFIERGLERKVERAIQSISTPNK